MVILAIVASLVALPAPVSASGPAETWTTQVPAANLAWNSVTYGGPPGLERFVAVASNGTNRVMTSSAVVTPAFSASTSTTDGFTVDVTNHLPSVTWSASAQSGTVTLGTVSGSALPLTITGLTPGTETTATVTVTRNGFTYGTATVSGGPLAPPTLETVLAAPETALLDTNTLVPGDLITITIGGFIPDEPVMLVIASTPRILATGNAGAEGVVTITGAIPPDMTSGDHTIAVIAPVSGVGYRQTIALGSRQLPETGALTPLFIAFVLLLAGVGILVARRQHLDYER